MKYKPETKSAANEYLNKFFYGATPEKKEGGKPFSIDEWEKKREKKERRRMREVEWCRWGSNSSGSQSGVHVTADGLTTLCNKKIPQIRKSNLSGVKPRSDEWLSGRTSSATGRTDYDTFVRYSSTVEGLVPACHERDGTCKCCVKRSKGKFINNQRTNNS